MLIGDHWSAFCRSGVQRGSVHTRLRLLVLFYEFKSDVATMWSVVFLLVWRSNHLILFRSIHDTDGSKVAKWFYEDLFSKEVIDADAVAYSLDKAVGNLRDLGVPLKRWAPFIHVGAFLMSQHSASIVTTVMLIYTNALCPLGMHVKTEREK